MARRPPPPRPQRRPSPAGEQVEGRQAVRELLRAGRRRTSQLLISDSADESPAVGEILELATRAGVPVRRVGRAQIASMARTDAPQGVVALAQPLPEMELDQLLSGPAPFLVVLDGVTDPHNLGAVMRSSLCAGATGVVLGRHRAAGLTPSAVKAAAGAAEHLPVVYVAGVPSALAAMNDVGVWTVGLDAGSGTGLWGLPVATQPVAVVLGAEGAGLSRLARQRCEMIVSIPIQGPLDSLNVSAAAALACFEIARQRSAERA